MDGFWHVDRQELPFGLGRGERVAGNAGLFVYFMLKRRQRFHDPVEFGSILE